MRRGVRYLFIRNIDNAAALVDDAWLTIFGHAVESQLDAIIEVAQRLPGQKGGALILRRWRLANRRGSFVCRLRQGGSRFVLHQQRRRRHVGELHRWLV